MKSRSEKIESFRNKSRQGTVRGVRIIYGDLATVDHIAQSEMDFIYLDQQHGTVTTRDIYEITAMLAWYDIVILVRTPDGSSQSIGLALDAGAHGVLAPEIETEEQAIDFVRSTRFPPFGDRSWGEFAAGTSGYSGSDEISNPICWALIESKTALGQVEKFALIDGIDGLYIGRFDLALSMSVSPKDIANSELLRAEIENIFQIAQATGKPIGTSGDFSELKMQGFRILTVRSELDLLSNGLKKYLHD